MKIGFWLISKDHWLEYSTGCRPILSILMISLLRTTELRLAGSRRGYIGECPCNHFASFQSPKSSCTEPSYRNFKKPEFYNIIITCINAYKFSGFLHEHFCSSSKSWKIKPVLLKGSVHFKMFFLHSFTIGQVESLATDFLFSPFTRQFIKPGERSVSNWCLSKTLSFSGALQLL